jgi:hypothetical protein
MNRKSVWKSYATYKKVAYLSESTAKNKNEKICLKFGHRTFKGSQEEQVAKFKQAAIMLYCNSCGHSSWPPLAFTSQELIQSELDLDP